jgi:ribonuclease BN (tRNA processing enzyme)
MRVEFFGTSGFHPNAERHTAGIFLPDAAPGAAFLLDAGTGTWRLTERPLPAHLHIFLTHSHLDHVVGLTFLIDVCYQGNIDVTLYGEQSALDTVCNVLFDSPLFPLPFEHKMVALEPNHPIEVEGVEVSISPLTHPNHSYAYRLKWPDRSLAYVTDTLGDGAYFDFIRGVDLLIHERNFPDRLRDIAEASGHCTTSDLVAAAQDSGAKTVVATHFNPLTTSDPLLEDDVYSLIPGVIAAKDEMVLEF